MSFYWWNGRSVDVWRIITKKIYIDFNCTVGKPFTNFVTMFLMSLSLHQTFRTKSKICPSSSVAHTTSFVNYSIYMSFIGVRASARERVRMCVCVIVYMCSILYSQSRGVERP